MLPWVLVLVWSALQMLIARQVHIQQRGPIDFLTYQIAADKVARGESPYGTIDEDLAIWATYHRLDEQFARCRPTDPPEHPVHSRTPVLLRFSVRLPSVTATGRWRERGRMTIGLVEFETCERERSTSGRSA